MMKSMLKIAVLAVACGSISMTANAGPFGNGGIFKSPGGGLGNGGSVFKGGNSGIFKKPGSGLGGLGGSIPVHKPGPRDGIFKKPGNVFIPKPSGGGSSGGGHKHHHGGGWLLAGVSILASDYDGCGYEYYKWKSTGSAKWRERYYECRE